MSTNYYWYARLPNGMPIPCEDTPEIHIGLSAAGKFMWAQKPQDVLQVCRDKPNTQVVQDEYQRPMTGREFIDFIDSFPEEKQVLDHIGEAFC